MARIVEPGQLAIDQFPAFEADGVSKRSGLAYPADFTISTFHNGVEEALTVALSEIGTTGEYRVTFTPPTAGLWVIQALIHFNDEIWQGKYDAGPSIFSIQSQVDKIDKAPTLGPAAVTSGSLMDRMMNKDTNKTYNQGTDSLEAQRDRTG